MEAIFRDEAWEHMNQPVSVENETAVCENMIEGLRAAVQAYPTSLADDLKAADSADVVPGTPADIGMRVRTVRAPVSVHCASHKCEWRNSYSTTLHMNRPSMTRKVVKFVNNYSLWTPVHVCMST